MITRFLVIAAVMVVVALACVLVPMLRSARRGGRPRAPFVFALLLAVATPPAVLALYLAIGTPQALQPPAVEGHADLAAATGQLEASLAKKPNDAQGWALLAQAYSALKQPQQELGALEHLMKLKPDDADVIVAWVEARAELHPGHEIDDAARAKLQRALQLDPTDQHALWLTGISDFQRGQYADAARQWKTLLPLLPPGSKVAITVQQELAEAETRAGGSPTAAALAAADMGPAAATTPGPAAATTPGNAAMANADPVALKITVKLDPKLAAEVQPGDTVFVFARAVNGPAMPLAVARTSASTWPIEVTLTDAMAMAPKLKLSQFREVQVAARVSKTGNAIPQSGDLESSSVRVATDSGTPVALTIDRVD